MVPRDLYDLPTVNCAGASCSGLDVDRNNVWPRQRLRPQPNFQGPPIWLVVLEICPEGARATVGPLGKRFGLFHRHPGTDKTLAYIGLFHRHPGTDKTLAYISINQHL